ncbi:MAG: UDP-N-acetylmuramoyl-L-alanyl-D-glutamate--2,6-diaminopimelate ligase [Gemmatimonadaceae bacterium]|nr:UDP-N-acetylmuramoyl-L-alanyl-D-glutamate--2,6-diaminopimelate ligase [Gemmatimonadaceae bacterium]
MTTRLVYTGVLIEALRAAGLLVAEPSRRPDVVLGLTDDSRSVVSGGAFIAVRGTHADGHAFVGDAVARGATLLFAEDAVQAPVAVVRVRDGRRAAAVIATAFFGRPAENLRLVGVTGTNGKTTTVHLVRALLAQVGVSSASVGTLGVLTGRDGVEVPGGQGLTTPGPVEMQRLLRTLVDAGVRVAALEVSSHALDQARVEGVAFDVAVFTSFSRDHLDYHGTMEAYFAAKARLATLLKPHGVAVVNAGEPAWTQLPDVPRLLTFHDGLGDVPDDVVVQAVDVRFDAAGSSFGVRVRDTASSDATPRVRLPLLGDFNVTNALGAMAAAYALGVPLADVTAALAEMPQVPGRLERLAAPVTVLRDYAHTPDALERALQAVRPFARTPDGAPTRVHVVFGCGGDRDRGKRPEMGAIAERLADAVIVTSDNPRTEDPECILDEIVAGMERRTTSPPVTRIEDRREAIAFALRTAAEHDVVLLAGKGHETYQIRGTDKLPFDEAVIVQELSREMRATREVSA